MTLTEVLAEVANHSGEIADLFKPGAKVKILIRNPGLDEGDMAVTDDSFDSAIEALEKLKAKEERKLTHLDVLKSAIE
jgi:hypothetical protein